MAYLKYNSSRLIRNRTPSNDFVIYSEIIGSQSSYEVPKKIQTIDSLQKWFGTEYPGYTYHVELLSKGASLLLYKPISLEKRKDTESYLDYSGFPVDDEIIYGSTDEIPVPPDRLIYRRLDINGEIQEMIWVDGEFKATTEGEPEVNYVLDDELYPFGTQIIPESIDRRHLLHQVISETTGNIDYYVWVDEISEYVDVNLLPQNIGVSDRSASWNNRDSLCLTSYYQEGDEWITYPSHPRYCPEDTPEWVPNDDTERLGIIRDWAIRYDIENNSHYTFALDLDFSGVTEWPTDGYICFYVGYDQTRKMIYFSDEGIVPNADFVEEGSDYRYLIDPTGKTKEQVISEIWRILEGQLDTKPGRPRSYVIHRIPGTSGYWSEYPIPNDCFWKLPGLRVTPNERASHDLVAAASPEPRITITPRTIGKHEDPLKVTIEKQAALGIWKLTVSRGSYGEEVHVGSLFPIDNTEYAQYQGYEFLEYAVNRDSELIRVKINHYYTDPITGRLKPWKKLDPTGIITDTAQPYPDLRYCPGNRQYYQDGQVLPNPDLPEGTWTLKGATPETYTPAEYQRSLDALVEVGVKEDFLMVPEIDLYRTETNLSGVSWFPEYEVLLAYAKEVGCQVVISNRDIGEEIQANTVDDFKASIREPKENWIYKVVLPGDQVTPEVCANPDHNTSIGVRFVQTYYALSESQSESPTKGWRTVEPMRTPEKYLWIRSSITYYDNTTDTTDPVCLLPGDTVVPEYRLSESSTQLTDGEVWTDESPEWKSGVYLWIRYRVTWDSGTATLYYRWEGPSGWVHKLTGREDCNPWLNEFIWNYVQCTDDLRNPKDLDLDNYLVYFYREMTGQTGETRPAYYAFLDGILTDQHNYRRGDIFYSSPVVDPLYLGEDEVAMDTALESMKSNFLVTDGYGYYYRKYFNHTGSGKFKTSILTKFFQSKLSRDFDRRKWDIIGTRTTAEALEIINGILDSFTASFKLVAYATLDDYEVNRADGSIDIWVTMRSKELVDKDISLNITLNYTN